LSQAAPCIQTGGVGYDPLKERGYAHEITFLKGKKESASELMPRMHRIASLLKRWILGTHQGTVSHEQMCRGGQRVRPQPMRTGATNQKNGPAPAERDRAYGKKLRSVQGETCYRRPLLPWLVLPLLPLLRLPPPEGREPPPPLELPRGALELGALCRGALWAGAL
jgi:hypothetical protein